MGIWNAKSPLATVVRIAAVGGCLAATTLESTAAGAQDPLIDELIAQALAANPDVLAAADDVAAARARPDQAGALPDPMASVVYTNDGWEPSLGSETMTTLGLMAEQQLPLGHKRRLRREVAAREADQAAERLARARLRLTAEVKRAYYALAEARQLTALAREQQQVWRETESSARTRYSVGQGAQQDVLRVQIELTRAQQVEAEREGEAEVRLTELNRLVGRGLDEPLTREPAPLSVQPLGIGQVAALDQARTLSPDRREIQVGLERDRLAVQLARSRSSPDLSLQGGYMNRGGLAPMWQAGVGFSLPLNRKSRAAAVAEAGARLRSREHALAAVERDLAAATYERLTLLATAEKTIAFYEHGIVPQDRMSVEAALANYRTGGVPFVSVLEALNTLYADRERLVNLLAEHARLRTQQEEASLEAPAASISTGMPAAAAMPASSAPSPMPQSGGGM